jgi:hypothetical protein
MNGEQGRVKVAGGAYIQGQVCASREETPHPSRVPHARDESAGRGPASAQGRGIEIKILALSQGRVPDEGGRVRGLFHAGQLSRNLRMVSEFVDARRVYVIHL